MGVAYAIWSGVGIVAISIIGLVLYRQPLDTPTLAGIGMVESRHGTYAGGELGPDGTTTVDVIGIPLDGTNNTQAIPDTDGGEYDGDTQWDRAIGPMQFIPGTWARWGVSLEGGDPDPQEFGAAVVLSDLDADGCVDLVVGAPGADRVYLVNGRRADQRVADLTWTAEDLLPGVTGRERFGAALAVERVNVEPGQPGHGQHRIWIGAPDAVVGGREAAGAVVHLLVDADLRVTSPAVLSQDSPGVPGGAEAGDRFGAVLEPVGDVALPSTDEQLPPAGFPSGVAVGVPHEDLGRAADAGMVVLLPAPGGPALPTPRFTTMVWSQACSASSGAMASIPTA